MPSNTSWSVAVVFIGLCYLQPAVAAASDSSRLDIKRLELEQLMEIDIYTASRRFEPYLTAPNAVYVLTGEEIRRAGVLSVPEALRLVPGVHVARIDANKWAVSIRGFNSRTANKLLVLIDGRTVYDPLFSGTLWESRDVMLANVERIEVIRGPGGALWGANAVNGVINIITKGARETQGTYAEFGAGTEERAFGAARFGWQTGANQYARVYANTFERDEGFLPNSPTFDDTRMHRAGFRWDWNPGRRDELTVSGDVFQGEAGELRGGFPPQDVGHEGGNVVASWRRRLSATESVQVNFFYDHFRLDNLDLGESRDTFDLELQHSFMPTSRQFLAWGLGYRNVQDDIRNGRLLAVEPLARVDVTTSAFVQDTFALVPEKWQLTLGTKVERNDYTGTEWQPSARVAWTPDTRRMWWASASRAVRVPSRLEADIVRGDVRSGANFDSERVYAYELGYRRLLSSRLWYDVAAFYNDYRGLLTIEPGFVFQNFMDGHTYGVEFATRWQPTNRWQLDAAYTFFRMNLQVRPESVRTDLPAIGEGTDPRHQLVLRSAYDYSDNLEIDATWRFVDDLPALNVPAYTALDLGVTWFPRPHIALSLVGQNLTEPHHPEANVATGLATEAERGVYAKLRWEY